MTPTNVLSIADYRARRSASDAIERARMRAAGESLVPDGRHAETRRGLAVIIAFPRLPTGDNRPA